MNATMQRFGRVLNHLHGVGQYDAAAGKFASTGALWSLARAYDRSEHGTPELIGREPDEDTVGQFRRAYVAGRRAHGAAVEG